MNIDDRDIERIEAYLNEELTSPEVKSLEKELVSRPELQRYLREQQAIKSALRADFRQKVKAQLQKEESGTGIRRALALAATALILIAGLTYYFQTREPSTPETLYNAHFEPYKNYLAPVTRDQAPQDSVERAMHYYEAGQYQQAQLWLKGYQGDSTLKVQIYRANALLDLDSTQQALPLLKKLAALPQFTYQEQTRWYMALAYLKLHKKDSAKLFLEELNSEESVRGRRAKVIYEAL